MVRIAALCLLGMALAAWLGSCDDATSPPSGTRPLTTTAGPPTQPAQPPRTLLDFAGAGSEDSRTFTATDAFEVNWTVQDPHGYDGYFSATLYDADTKLPAATIGDVQVPANGSMADSSHVHDPGTYHLQIHGSAVDWHVIITGG